MKIGTKCFGIEFRLLPYGRFYFSFWRRVSESSLSIADKQRIQLSGRVSRSRSIAGGLLQQTTVYETEERFKERQGYGSPRQ